MIFLNKYKQIFTFKFKSKARCLQVRLSNEQLISGAESITGLPLNMDTDTKRLFPLKMGTNLRGPGKYHLFLSLYKV